MERKTTNKRKELYLYSDTRPIQDGMGSPVHRVSMGDTWSRQVHPDIESERCRQSFDVERLTNILDGGAQNTALRREVGKRRLRNGACALCPYIFLRRRVFH